MKRSPFGSTLVCRHGIQKGSGMSLRVAEDKWISNGTQLTLVLKGSMAASATSDGLIIFKWSTPSTWRVSAVSTKPASTYARWQACGCRSMLRQGPRLGLGAVFKMVPGIE